METPRARLVKSKQQTICAAAPSQSRITLEDLIKAQALIERRFTSLQADFQRFFALVIEYEKQRDTVTTE
jgi:hypothetical protein